MILAGGYEEAGDEGRQRLRPGDVLLHAPFEAHLDRFDRSGAVVLNLPWAAWDPQTAGGRRRFADVDGLARLARREPRAAAAWLEAVSAPVPRASRGDWPDALASELTACPALSIGDWARARGLSPATVSRGFRRVFGGSPARFRAESRARTGWRRLMQEPDAPLAVLALDAGFADQAHLSRAVRALTGIAAKVEARGARQIRSIPRVSLELGARAWTSLLPRRCALGPPDVLRALRASDFSSFRETYVAPRAAKRLPELRARL